jgi:uncharacterized protein YdhG (YjbR/CyaY superfamily)
VDNPNNNIEKIDEQIESLMNAEKQLFDDNNENKIVQTEEYVESDTKVIDNIENLNNEEVKDVETTSKFTAIPDNQPTENVLDDKKDEVEVLTEVPAEEDKTKKKKKKIILVIIMFVILLVIILLSIILHKESVTEEPVKTYTNRELKEIMIEYGDSLKGAISMYLEKDKVLLEYDDAVKLIHNEYNVECDEHEIYEDGLIYLNQCFVDGYEIPYSYGEKQEKKEEVVVEGNSVTVYVSNIDQSASLTEPTSLDDYTQYDVLIDGDFSNLELLGEKESYLIYKDNKYHVQMVNFVTGRKVLDALNYTAILPICIGEDYDTHYIAVLVDKKWGIYEFTRNERVVPHLYDTIDLYVGVTSSHKNCITAITDGVIAVSDSNMEGIINYRTGEVILPLNYADIRVSGNYIWAYESDGRGRIFDYNGKELLVDEYDNIYRLEDGKFALVLDEKDVKLVTIQGEELYNYGEIELGLFTHSSPYKDGALFGFINNGPDGGCLEIIYDGFSKEGKVENITCGNIAKPVLYLYPKKKTKVTISFEHPELLETTYPKYDKKWVVEAHSDGSLYDSKNKYYYGLYWDEKKEHTVDFSSGFYVEKENAINFLEEKLKIIGLSDREANEFIMYWLPKMEENGNNLVHFEFTKDREKVNKINIEPKPDSMLRLGIVIKKVDKKVKIKAQKLEHFDRVGFSVVEWGGTIIN